MRRTQETNDKAATVAEQRAHVAPAKPASRKGASRRSAPKAKKSVSAPKKTAKAPHSGKQKDAAEARSNEKAEVIAMMRHAKGGRKAESSKNAAREMVLRHRPGRLARRSGTTRRPVLLGAECRLFRWPVARHSASQRKACNSMKVW
jgi:hypothetical protein